MRGKLSHSRRSTNRSGSTIATDHLMDESDHVCHCAAKHSCRHRPTPTTNSAACATDQMHCTHAVAIAVVHWAYRIKCTQHCCDLFSHHVHQNTTCTHHVYFDTPHNMCHHANDTIEYSTFSVLRCIVAPLSRRTTPLRFARWLSWRGVVVPCGHARQGLTKEDKCSSNCLQAGLTIAVAPLARKPPQ